MYLRHCVASVKMREPSGCLSAVSLSIWLQFEQSPLQSTVSLLGTPVVVPVRHVSLTLGVPAQPHVCLTRCHMRPNCYRICGQEEIGIFSISLSSINHISTAFISSFTYN